MADTPVSPKILLVDDDDALRQLYVTELTNRKYQTIEAANGQEGLVKAKAEKPSLILLDVMMPDLDGIATLTQLKQDQELKDIPVMMLTNFGQENLVKQAFSLGATDYLLKYKVTPSEMADKVGQIFSSKPVQL